MGRDQKVALGPIRFRRIVLPPWAALLLMMGYRVSVPMLVAVAACAVVAVRAARTRVELRPDEIIVVNLLTTTRVPRDAVVRAGFCRE
jgi:hypothetical protein